jgi:hypothetical protein
MLAHRSGIYDFTNDREFRSWKNQAKTKDEMLAIIAKGKPVFEPGEKTEYSNSGFVLLGYIVEKVGGKPYQNALKGKNHSKNRTQGIHISAPEKPIPAKTKVFPSITSATGNRKPKPI